MNSNINQQLPNSQFSQQQQQVNSNLSQQSIPQQQQFNPNASQQSSFSNIPPQQQLNPNLSQQSSFSNIPQQQQLNPNLSQQSSFSNIPPQQQLNPNLSQQSSFSNIPPQQQLNPNLSQQSSFSNISQQQLNPNLSQQSSFSNIPQQQQLNPNLSQQSSFSNMPQQNVTNFQQQQFQSNTRKPNLPPTPNKPPKRFLKTQSFKVVYNGTNYIVDPISLANSSLRFKELIQPYIQDFEQMRSFFLEIKGVQFSNRNMNNFLRLCQKLPTDVQNSEMEEICEIAKMFKAEEIYNTGLSFIKSNIDPNFNVPDNKYEEQEYLSIGGQSNNIPINQELSDAFFEDANDKSYQGQYYQINCSNTSDNSNNMIPNQAEFDSNQQQQQQQQQEQIDTENHVDLNNHSALHDPVYGLDDAVKNRNENKSDNNEFRNESNQNKDDDNKSKSSDQDKKHMHSTVYQVRVENHTFKCPIFKFVSDQHIIYVAKQKYNEIYIAEGMTIHISNKENHVAHIHQEMSSLSPFNNINLKDIHFDLKYVSTGIQGYRSIEVSFPLNGEIINWIPKPPTYNSAQDKYYLNLHGEYHHTPILSSKNIVLQNLHGHSTFIVRKMNPNVYEIECLPIVDPLIAFCIGLSDIVGPFTDIYDE